MGNRQNKSEDVSSIQSQESTPSSLKEFFIKALKKRYKEQYDAIQPIPYIKDRLYCVDKVFVEGGIEIYSDEDKSWIRAGSYKDAFLDKPQTDNILHILEAEAGYGKSTVTLQLAYDWCNGVQDSPLANKEILILLRLRQLGGYDSIYEAIKELLVSEEPEINSSDIKDIIEDCESVEILLDGYDEYPDRDSETGSDVILIINREMFQNIPVVLTTRYLPKGYDRSLIVRSRLLGFDDEARDQYIRKAVTGNRNKKVLKIKRSLKHNPILDDLCQVPLFFVMFAHMTHEKKDFRKLKSVTEFFRFMLKCFHSHMRNKSKHKNTKRHLSEYEFEHTKLSQVAFDGLSQENQQLTWKMQELREKLGEGFYDYYVAVGILVEEELLKSNKRQNAQVNILGNRDVRFYHKLFCEYYASFTLVEKAAAANVGDELNELLDKLDPFDLQYLFRFSCGKDAAVGNKIIQYLKGKEGGDKFAILCILEQTGKVDDVRESVKDICKDTVYIRNEDGKLLKRSTTQLLEIATSYNIPVSRLLLDRCLIAVGEEEISLASDNHLDVLSSLTRLDIKTQKGKVFTLDEFVTVLTYSGSCDKLKHLTLIDCVLPLWMPPETLSNIFQLKDITVAWQPTDKELRLELPTGVWSTHSGDDFTLPVKNHQCLQDFCATKVKFTKNEKMADSKTTIFLLDVASSHNMSVTSVSLHESLLRADETSITLVSGINVPTLWCIEELEIISDYHQDYTEENITHIFKYGQGCQALKKIRFVDCLLPLSVSDYSLPSKVRSGNLQVTWNIDNRTYHLHGTSGKWHLGSLDSSTITSEDYKALSEKFSSEVILRESDTKYDQTITTLMIENASKAKIPVTCLTLNKRLAEANQDGITLNDMYRLLPIPSLETLNIKAVKDQEFTETEVLGLLNFGRHCQRLKKICFVESFLPISLPPMTYSATFQVIWRSMGHDFHLNFSMGEWHLQSQDSQTLTKDNRQKLTKMCSNSITLKEMEDKHSQAHTILLLGNASYYKIAIPCVICENSVTDAKRNGLTLTSGLQVPVLRTMERLEITTKRRKEYTPENVFDFINYCQECSSLEKISFVQVIMPLFFLVNSLRFIKDTLQIVWRPLQEDFTLDKESGKWKMTSDETFTINVDNKQSLSGMCSDRVIIRQTNSQQCNQTLILLLEIATSNDIGIQRLVVESNTISGDSTGLEIQPGVCIPALMTLETLEIKTEKGQELEHHTVLELLDYVMECPQLTKITFIDCLLPLSFSGETILSNIRSKDLQVFWRPTNHEFCLDDSNGKWEMKTNDQSIWIEYDGDETLTELCKDTMFLRETDSAELQRTMILLLEIASTHQIPISELFLKWSFRGFDGDNIRLESGLCISSLSSVEKISINGDSTLNSDGSNQQLSEGEVTGLLNFGIKSRRFQELWFNNCKLPSSINPASIPEEANSRNAKVFSSNDALSFNLETGQWTEPEDIETITTMCSDGLAINNRTSESVQRSVIELLVKATNHDIPISQVGLIKSFDKIDEDGLNIILKSGLLLPNISSMERMMIQTEDGREMKEEEVNGILNYLQQNKRLEELYLDDCVLPSRIRLGPAADTLRSRNVKVFWTPDTQKDHQYYRLDLTTGHLKKEGSW